MTSYCGIVLPDANTKGSRLSDSALRMVVEFVEAHLCTLVTLDQLAALVHLSPVHVARCLKATMGLAPYQYLLARRMERVKLLSTTLTSAEIGWSLGYTNISHFRRIFAQQVGVTPSALRQLVGVQAQG